MQAAKRVRGPLHVRRQSSPARQPPSPAADGARSISRLIRPLIQGGPEYYQLQLGVAVLHLVNSRSLAAIEVEHEKPKGR
jgi:hypothetical protein